MAKKLNAAEAAMNEKMRVLMKLRNNGVHTEKDVHGLKAETMLTLPGITVPEMRIIIETQKSVRDSRFFSYLMEAPENMLPECVSRMAQEDSPSDGCEEGGDGYV